MVFRVVLPICLLGLLLGVALWFQDELTSGTRARQVELAHPSAGDVLRLEVGGDHPRLSVPREQGRPPRVAPPRPQPEPPTPQPTPEKPRRWVELQEGETVYALCERHLGDGSRLREVLELNGLTEAEARRLRPGEKILLP